MMSDLFSSLDGCFSFMFWLPSMLFVLLFINFSYMSSVSMYLVKFHMNFHMDGTKKLQPFNLLMPAVMFILFYMNMLGLTPFSYSMTSSLWFASSIALTVWLMIMTSSMSFSPKKTLAHLVPSGAPNILIPFLILIETISLIIRPLTLTVRLIANISAGHIVLSLVANVLTGLTGMSLIILLFTSIAYNMFEMFVCFIQAYIFSLLLKLYSLEHPF